MRRLSFPRFFFYLVYGLMLMAVLLYVRFPTEAFKTYCERRLEKLSGIDECSIYGIGYHFPFTLELEQVKFLVKSGGENRVAIDNFQLSPVKNLFGKWRLEGSCYGGELSALLEIQLKRKMYSLHNIHFENIDLASLAGSIPALGRELTGRLDFTGEYEAGIDKPLAGTGRGHLLLKKGRIHLAQSVLTLETIDFEEINVRLRLQNRLLVIQKGKMDGNDMEATFAGTIRAPFFPPHGSLRMNGLLFSSAEFLAGRPVIARFFDRLKQPARKPSLRFRIGGTLNRPTFRLSAAGTF
jgi:type II secretion system protein N